MASVDSAGKAIGVIAAVAATTTLLREGVPGLLYAVTKTARALPGVNAVVDAVLAGEVSGAVGQMVKDAPADASAPGRRNGQLVLREDPMTPAELETVADELQAGETATLEGKAFAYVYTSEARMAEHSQALRDSFAALREPTGAGPEHDALVARAFDRWMHDNALNPMIFPSLRKFETEVVSVCAGLLGGDARTVGAMVSGTSECALMALKAYRSRAAKAKPDADATAFEVLLPVTAAGEWARACDIMGLSPVWLEVGDDLRLDAATVAAAITPRTAVVVVAAPTIHGVVDNVADVAAAAARRGVPVHVDAALGGMLLPWVSPESTAAWDLSVPGVSSVSLDLTTYGYCGKGSAVMLYEDTELRAMQYFAYAQWPGGLFGSPSLLGTRAGGNLAATWVALNGLGAVGLRRLAAEAVDKAGRFASGLAALGLKVLARPEAAVVAFSFEDADRDVFALHASLPEWPLRRRFNPRCLTLVVNAATDVDGLLAAIAGAVEAVQPGRHFLPAATAEEMEGMLASTFGG